MTPRQSELKRMSDSTLYKRVSHKLWAHVNLVAHKALIDKADVHIWWPVASAIHEVTRPQRPTATPSEQ